MRGVRRLQPRMTRRTLLAAALAPASRAFAAASAIRLEIGNYGMQSLPVDRALAAIREIGYDGAELCCIPEWPSEPKKLDTAARRRIREFGLPIPSLIESFNLMAPDAVLSTVPDRIRAAAALAHDIAPSKPPLLQTVLGGKQGEFETIRDTMAQRLGEWARVAGESGIRLAVKAHASNACDTPDKLGWLLDKVHHPALTAIYDYGHFQLAGLGIEESMDTLLPRSAFITVKDSKLVDGKPVFLLPGDGSIDYARYFAKVKELKWTGWVLVEVTRQLQTQPGYDGIEAARRSYANLAPVLQRAGLR
jgi:sugar phosphate isomerase/epimerase